MAAAGLQRQWIGLVVSLLRRGDFLWGVVNASLAFIEGAKPRDELLYPILTFDDGSVLWLKSVGTGTIDGTKTQFVGTVTVVGGKGRFHGVRGDRTLTGTRYTPLSVGADLVSDYTVHIEK
jgi:hypothetical protein